MVLKKKVLGGAFGLVALSCGLTVSTSESLPLCCFERQVARVLD